MQVSDLDREEKRKKEKLSPLVPVEVALWRNGFLKPLLNTVRTKELAWVLGGGQERNVCTASVTKVVMAVPPREDSKRGI